MKFSVWPGPAQPWESTLELALHAEKRGYDGIWYADHFMPNAEDVSGPTNEAWTTLAALAASVPRIRIGPLVTGNTYRHPAVLAKMAATVDNISAGRLVLGLGAGWQENEHQKYGIEFSTLGGRMRRLEEACQVVKSLFLNDRTDFAGRYYQLTDAPLVPKPAQRTLPLLIGGGGEKVTMRIAATYADEWNVWGGPEILKQKGAVLEEHCRAIGRDPKEIHRSAQGMLVLTDDKEMIERMKASGRPVIAGNGAQVREVVQAYADAGVDELIIPDFNLGSGSARLGQYDRFWDEVAIHFR
ncbi:MAG: TIGR03560 family F420-dependent LLM class oxidoreductase [Dehalococcoidia bacterium]|nr:TIGR03560 family F420-dependent LLM class oxidoreductase [Dehalococcoidia bacterium]MCB9485406.1 TIGR03560 family F420-dependent LLM class oxidoreductase [Thermoflexaceae bacterium]